MKPNTDVDGRRARLVERLSRWEGRAVAFTDEHAVGATYLAFAVVFLWYGGVKLAPELHTPVYEPVDVILESLGVPALLDAYGLPYRRKPFLMAIGLYEFGLGVLFALRKLRLVLVPFLIHQLTTLASLFVAPYVFFDPPFLFVHGVAIPWMQGSFSAYVLKNLVFIGGFLLLYSMERGRDTGAAPSPSADRSP